MTTRYRGGGVFARAIRQAAERAGMTDVELHELATRMCEKPVADVTDPGEANRLIAAVKAFATP